MDALLKIYIDQLKDGKVEKIDISLSPDLFDIHEANFSYLDDAVVRGEAYIAGEGLVLHLDIDAAAAIPCSICNEPVRIPVTVKNLYHVEPIEDIRAGVFEMGEVIRENILLETPAFAECNQGHCPQRKTISKYLKKDHPAKKDEEEGYRPFSDLSID